MEKPDNESLVHNPHDKFFKNNFRQEIIVTTYVRLFVDPETVQTLDFSRMKLKPTSFITQDLTELHSDIIWEIGVLGQKETLDICFVFEHKSSPDRMVAFQMMQYMNNIWAQQIKAGKELKLIIGVLVYHGSKEWEYTPIHEFFPNYPAPLRRYLPRWDIEYHSMAHVSTEVYLGITDNIARYNLLVMSRSKTKQLPSALRQLFYEDKEITRKELRNLRNELIPYIFAVSDDKHETIQFFQDLPSKINDTAMNVYQQILEEGREIGREIGKAQADEVWALRLQELEQEKLKALEQEKQKALKAAEQERLKAEQEKQKALKAAEQEKQKALKAAEQEKTKTILNLIQKTQFSNAEIADLTGATEDHIQVLREGV